MTARSRRRRRSALLVKGLVLGLMPALLLAGCRVDPQRSSTTPSGAAAQRPTDFPGWDLVASVLLPRSGEPRALNGSGRYRTFGWSRDERSQPHQWGVADLRAGTVTVSSAEPTWTTTGNVSAAGRVVHVQLDQPAGQEAVRFRLTTQLLPSGAVQDLDASRELVPLGGQPTVVFAGGSPVWSRADASCRCYTVSSAAAAPDGTLGAPRELIRQEDGLLIKSDGARILVLSRRTRVLDPASGTTVPLPGQFVGTGAILGDSVALLRSGSTDGTTAGSEVLLYQVPRRGPARLVRRFTVPEETGQISFVDGRRLLLFRGGDDQVLDLRTGTATGLPMAAAVDSLPRYAVGDGTLSLVLTSGARRWLAVYRPTAP